jgi:hypothetical protein
MYIEDFIGCCRASIIYHFPYDDEASIKEIKEEILDEINCLIKDGEGYTSILFATTAPGQKKASKVLEELGFYSLPTPAKSRDRDKREIQGWMLPMNEWEHN